MNILDIHSHLLQHNPKQISTSTERFRSRNKFICLIVISNFAVPCVTTSDCVFTRIENFEITRVIYIYIYIYTHMYYELRSIDSLKLCQICKLAKRYFEFGSLGGLTSQYALLLRGSLFRLKLTAVGSSSLASTAISIRARRFVERRL